MTDELDALEKRLQQHSADDANTPDASIVMDEAQHALASLRRQLAEIDAALNAAGQVTLTGEQPRPFTQRIADLHAEYLRRHKAACDEWLRAEEIQSQLTAEREKVENLHGNLRLERELREKAEADKDIFAAAWEDALSKLAVERERAERMREEEVTASICFDKVVKERDAALADARELREWADAMNTALDAFWNDPERPSLHRMRSETTSKICVLQEKHRTRIDAKLTEGA
jgi:hypothetical protein